MTPLNQEWTRIGRSLAADVRFDDATVSRRHALVVSQAEGVRVLDDRSLNGVYVNGERVEWAPLTDGDEITIGRHSIFFLDTATVGSAAPARSRRRVTVAGQANELLVAVAFGALRARAMAETIAVLSLKGGTGKTTTVRTLADVFRRIGLDVLAIDLDPQGNLSDYFDVAPDATPTIADVLGGQAKAKSASHGGRDPRVADPGRGGALDVGQDGPRARPAQGAQGRPQGARPRADRLPAGARPADDQRPRRRRLGARVLRGAVLRAAGRRGRARGRRAGEGVLQPGPRVPRRGAQHRRHAHRSTRARPSSSSRSTTARRSSRPSSAPRSPTPSRPRRASRSSTTAPTSARTTSPWPTRCCGASGSRTRARSSSRCSRRSPAPAGSRQLRLAWGREVGRRNWPGPRDPLLPSRSSGTPARIGYPSHVKRLAPLLLLALAGCGGAPAREPPSPRPTPHFAVARERARARRAARALGRPRASLRRRRCAPRPAGARVGRLRPRTEFGSPKVVSVLRRRGGWLRVVVPERPNGRPGLDPRRRHARPAPSTCRCTWTAPRAG